MNLSEQILLRRGEFLRERIDLVLNRRAARGTTRRAAWRTTRRAARGTTRRTAWRLTRRAARGTTDWRRPSAEHYRFHKLRRLRVRIGRHAHEHGSRSRIVHRILTVVDLGKRYREGQTCFGIRALA